jgi:hypothetical protein
MSERTTEGATPDRAGFEGFFVSYGEAVSAGDLNEEGRSAERNSYRYVLRLEDAGPRICALIATSSGG